MAWVALDSFWLNRPNFHFSHVQAWELGMTYCMLIMTEEWAPGAKSWGLYTRGMDLPSITFVAHKSHTSVLARSNMCFWGHVKVLGEGETTQLLAKSNCNFAEKQCGK